jgi:hypothetical protein
VRTFESTTQRYASEQRLRLREVAAERIVRSSVVLGVGMLLIIYGVTLDPLPWWIAFSVLSLIFCLYGTVGLVLYVPMYMQPIAADELVQRVYSGEDKPRQIKIVQHDGQTLRLTDLGLSAHEAMLVADRLERANWYWSRNIISGKASEENITNITSRYSDMRAEMQRVGALESEGGRDRVAPWAREDFILASPALTRKVAKNRQTDRQRPVV